MELGVFRLKDTRLVLVTSLKGDCKEPGPVEKKGGDESSDFGLVIDSRLGVVFFGTDLKPIKAFKFNKLTGEREGRTFRKVFRKQRFGKPIAFNVAKGYLIYEFKHEIKILDTISGDEIATVN